MANADLFIPYPAYELSIKDITDFTQLLQETDCPLSISCNYLSIVQAADTDYINGHPVLDGRRLPLVVYHANCLDGMTAAYQAWRGLKGLCLLVEWNYGLGPLPTELVTDRVVFTVDFSFTIDDCLKMRPAERIIVLDHHEKPCKEFEAALRQQPYHIRTWIAFLCHYDHSGAYLSWDYFVRSDCPDEHVPPMVSYVQDRDLWRFDMLNTKAYCEALAMYPKNIRAWYQADTAATSRLIDTGSLLLEAKQIKLRQLAEKAFLTTLEGWQIALVNTDLAYASELGELLYTEYFFDADFIAMYSIDDAKHCVNFSLRSSKTGSNVAEVAARFGGNGHKHAAGFSITLSELAVKCRAFLLSIQENLE
jgi:uncharacterized protein